jgi:hypothetical protein
MAAHHSVQFFDTHASAARALGHFVDAGLAKSEHIILVTRLDDWNRAAVSLALPGTSLGEAVNSGQLIVRDSARTLAALLVDGMPSAERFESTIAPLVSRSIERGGSLRAYGDMVDLLAAEGSFDAAAKLEELWNGLQARLPFTLFCGYSSAHFCNGHSAAALRRIRDLHSHEHCGAGDFVARHLMEPTS